MILGAQNTPPALAELVAGLSSRARELGLKMDDRPYHAHITMFRKARKPVDQTIALDGREQLILSPSQFVLFESCPIPGGVEYRPLGEWPIR